MCHFLPFVEMPRCVLGENMETDNSFLKPILAITQAG